MKTVILRSAFVVTESLAKRFELKATKEESGCLKWTGALNTNGYGRFKLCGVGIDAHVASWRIANKGIAVPIGFVVMHSCDNKTCVNPEHLSIGTQSENMKDAYRKGRMRDQSLNPNVPAILGAELVESVVELNNEGWSAHAISKKLGVSWSTMQRFMKRHSLKLTRRYCRQQI